jgi:hypothetical protein
VRTRYRQERQRHQRHALRADGGRHAVATGPPRRLDPTPIRRPRCSRVRAEPTERPGRSACRHRGCGTNRIRRPDPPACMRYPAADAASGTAAVGPDKTRWGRTTRGPQRTGTALLSSRRTMARSRNSRLAAQCRTTQGTPMEEASDKTMRRPRQGRSAAMPRTVHQKMSRKRACHKRQRCSSRIRKDPTGANKAIPAWERSAGKAEGCSTIPLGVPSALCRLASTRPGRTRCSLP